MTPLLAYISPQALHRVRGPWGPRRIMGVSCALAPQLTHLHANVTGVSPTARAIITCKTFESALAQHSRPRWWCLQCQSGVM